MKKRKQVCTYLPKYVRPVQLLRFFQFSFLDLGKQLQVWHLCLLVSWRDTLFINDDDDNDDDDDLGRKIEVLELNEWRIKKEVNGMREVIVKEKREKEKSYDGEKLGDQTR